MNSFFDTEYIEVKNSLIESNLNYQNFVNFMENLPFEHYNPNIGERHKVIILRSYFEDFLNLSQLYTSWNLSMTTRKNDMNTLEKDLKKYNLNVERYPGKGIKITGDPLQYRILIISIISDCIDVYASGIVKRRSNTPVEKYMYEYFNNMTAQFEIKSDSIVKSFLDEYQTNINYYSKKFFLLYVILVLDKENNPVERPKFLSLSPHNFYLFDDRNENIAFNHAVSMIDFDPIVPFPHQEHLLYLTQGLVEELALNEAITIYTAKQMKNDLYNYIYRQYFNNYYNYKYEDKLVKDVTKVFPERYDFVKEALLEIESYLDMSFNHEQISSITLIASKWILKNQVYGESSKRIVLVTNIGYERVHYFLESLQNYIDFEHVSTIDVNELHLLDSYDFDLILCFSSRTYSIVGDLGYKAIKIEYFLNYNNIITLFDAGCSIAKKHIIAKDLIKTIKGKNKRLQIEALKKAYPNIFL
ncbi:MAG: hypothetical protein GX038_03340 [Erysipelothrix sp.]|nr:hypothetical protein [Erysipelothrix sp.]